MTLAWRKRTEGKGRRERETGETPGSRFVSKHGTTRGSGYKWPPFPKPLRSPLWNAAPRGKKKRRKKKKKEVVVCVEPGLREKRLFFSGGRNGDMEETHPR